MPKYADYTIIDADGHVREAVNEIRELLPPEWRRDRLFPTDTWDRSLRGTLGRSPRDAHDQLGDMDHDGVDVAVLYPTATLGIGRIREREYAVALAQAYNDWMYGFCQVNPRRLKFAAAIAPQDVQAAAREVERAAKELGAVAVMPPTYVAQAPDWGDPHWDQIWEAAQRHDLGVAMHAPGPGGDEAGVNRFSKFLQAHAVVHPFEQMIAVCGMVIGGVFERFAYLRVAFLESGGGWVPYWLDRLDEEVEKRGAVEAPWLKAKPSDYVLSGRCFFGIEPGEKTTSIAVQTIGDDALLFSSDYPHWDSDWPHTVQTLLGREDLSQATKKKLLHDNAIRFYGERRLL